jgi:hypothetical protein
VACLCHRHHSCCLFTVCAVHVQALDAFLDLGVEYAHTLSELPMLDDLWHRAAAFDPVSDPLALASDPMKTWQRLQ